MPLLEIGSRRIEYVVLKGTSRRYTYFRFRPDLTLEIVLPRGRPVDIGSTVRSRAGWILRKYEEMSRSRRVIDGETVMFDGRPLNIVFQESLEREEILPDPPGGVVVVRSSDKRRIKELVRRWFLRETSRYVVETLASLSGAFPRFKRADVREIRNWGYCTRDGRLSFSWQLIALPARLREYILLHELTHLLEFNHSRAFKRRLESACPDYRVRERELDTISPYDSPTMDLAD